MTTLNSRLQLAMLNRKKARNALEKGFTLVELLIVVIIIGVLSGVALPAFLGQSNKAKDSAAKAYVAGVEKECQVALATTGAVPASAAAIETTGGSGVTAQSPGATTLCTSITAKGNYTGSSAVTSTVTLAGGTSRTGAW